MRLSVELIVESCIARMGLEKLDYVQAKRIVDFAKNVMREVQRDDPPHVVVYFDGSDAAREFLAYLEERRAELPAGIGKAQFHPGLST